MKFLIRVGFLLYALVQIGCSKQESEDSYVLMVSFDGFRYDYVEKYNLPNFKRFISEGSAAEALIPSFPSKTFPNHYSMATGLYPGHHGIIDNNFYDPNRERSYELHDSVSVRDSSFYHGTTLWALAKRNKLKTASLFWVGTEAPPYPDIYFNYDKDFDNHKRVLQVLDWLALPDEERPRFVTLYFSLIDDAGHNFGPNAPELEEALHEADALLGELMDGLAQLPVGVNTVITSDHGMTEMKRDTSTFVILQNLIDANDTTIRIFNNGSQAHIYCSNCDTLYTRLKSIETASHFQILRPDEFSSHWYYNTPLAGNFMIIANPGHYLMSSDHVLERISEMLGTSFGTHGFDPSAVPDMRGIFYARGPKIKQGMTIGPIKNVDVYPFVAKLLAIEPPQSDGTLESTKSLLK